MTWMLGYIAAKLGFWCSSTYSKTFKIGYIHGMGLSVWYKDKQIVFLKKYRVILGMCSRREWKYFCFVKRIPDPLHRHYLFTMGYCFICVEINDSNNG